MFIAIDAETTGLDHRKHEIIQLAIVPANENFKPIIDDVFEIKIKAVHPETADPDSLETNKLDMNEGVDHFSARLQVIDWIEKMKEKYSFELIIPLGQKYSFDKDFIIDLISFDYYQKFFSESTRDTKRAATFINDWFGCPHSSGLASQAKKFAIANDKHHDAVNDALVALEIYRKQGESVGVNQLKWIFKDFEYNVIHETFKLETVQWPMISEKCKFNDSFYEIREVIHGEESEKRITFIMNERN